MSQPQIELTAVVPMFNEEEVIETSLDHLTRVLSGLGVTYEVLVVDDGSRDQSFAKVDAYRAQHPHIKVIKLSRNFGHEMATSAGMRYAAGRCVVIIDADLQDPPEIIPEFHAAWKAGYDVVYGVRSTRKGESLLKRLTARLFYNTLAKVSDVPIPRNTGDFRLMDRRVVEIFNEFQEDPRFFRGLISWIGLKQKGIAFERQPRAGGVSKYRYGRLLSLAFDTITAFSTFPSLAITIMSALIVVGLGGISVSLVYMWMRGHAFSDWVLPMLGLAWLSVFQLCVVAVLGEYLVRTHRHVKRRPLFVVDRLVGIESSM